jgi:IS30 family transposase
MRTYHQLTQAQRYQIYPGTARQGRCALRKTNHTLAEMAEVIGVHKSSVSRELKRIEVNAVIVHNKRMNWLWIANRKLFPGLPPRSGVW